MKPMKKIMVAGFLLFCCTCFLASIVSASDCGCDAEPPGGWGPPDYTNDPSWGSTYSDELGGGGSSSAGDGGSGSSGAVDVNSGGDSGNGGSSGSDISSGSTSDSGGSSGQPGGSAEDGLIWRMKADDLAKQGLLNESLAAYDKSITYDPYTVKAWIGKGKVLLALGNASEAAASFSRAIRLDPGSTDALVLLGDAQNTSGSYKDAIESYTKALTLNPNLAGVKEKIALSETANNVASEKNTSDEVMVEVVTRDENTTVPESVSDLSASPSPVVQATHAAPFPGMSAILVVFGSCSLLMLLRKRNQ